jgi:hypothetical protein
VGCLFEFRNFFCGSVGLVKKFRIFCWVFGCKLGFGLRVLWVGFLVFLGKKFSLVKLTSSGPSGLPPRLAQVDLRLVSAPLSITEKKWLGSGSNLRFDPSPGDPGFSPRRLVQAPLFACSRKGDQTCSLAPLHDCS